MIKQLSLQDIHHAFTGTVKDHGFIFRGPVQADGQIHRVDAEGDRPGSHNAWYILFDNITYAAGCFGNWKTGAKHAWSSHEQASLSPKEWDEYEKAQALIKAAYEKDQQNIWRQAATETQVRWDQYQPADSRHPYLIKKNVQAHRVRQHKNALVIPVFNEYNELSTLQYIWQDSEGRFLKRFKARGRKAGGLFRIGELTPTIYIAEGYATAATIHEQTGCCTVVAFDAGNLEGATRNLYQQLPNRNDHTLIVAADNDVRTQGNPGITAATHVAKIMGARLVYPKFPAGAAGTDFNDLHTVAPELLPKQLNYLQSRKSPFSFISSLDMLEQPQPTNWLIKDFLETDSLALVFGPPGSSKSFITIDMACCIANGIDWHGCKVKSPHPVFYVAGEGQNGFRRRIKAWDVAHPGAMTKPVYFSQMSASLIESGSAKQVCEGIEQMLVDDHPPGLLVIDTLARNFGPGDENATKDMSQFIQHIDQHFRALWHCCVLVVHHTGVADQGRARGNSAMKGALDAEYRVAQTDDIVTITSKKMKDAAQPAPITFERQVISLPWRNEDGEPETSCAITRIDAQPEQTKRLGKTQRACLEVLQELYKAHRNKLSKSTHEPEGARVRFEDWCQSCVGANKPLPNRKNFSRIQTSLTDAGYIRLQPPYVYLENRNEEGES